MAAQRVTVTLPEELLAEMDQQAENRSLFVAEAVRAELQRRRRERLQQALQEPHSESEAMANCGFEEWVSMAGSDDESLLDPKLLRPVRWVPGQGWGRP